MRTLTYNFIYTALLALGMSMCFVGVAFAQSIEVDFETDPLFGQSNFLPGDTVSKTVKVTNPNADSQDVYTELLNVVDGGLGDVLDVSVTEGGNTKYGTTTMNIFDADGKVSLSTIPGNSSVTYIYHVTFQPQSGNSYQLATYGFDICIGFAGGPFECDNSTDGGGGGSDGGGGGSGGGGSSSGGGGATPQIAGAQTSVLPIGAPNTGGGPVRSAFPLNIFLGTILVCAVAVRAYRIAHD